jgi:hypothetical protein
MEVYETVYIVYYDALVTKVSFLASSGSFDDQDSLKDRRCADREIADDVVHFTRPDKGSGGPETNETGSRRTSQ